MPALAILDILLLLGLAGYTLGLAKHFRVWQCCHHFYSHLAVIVCQCSIHAASVSVVQVEDNGERLA